MEDLFESSLSCVLIIAIWILLAVLTGRLADKKGLQSGRYFLVSLLLSPIVGLLAVAVARPDRARAEQLRMASGGERKCPFCAELVKAEAKVCRFCGKDLPEPSPAVEPAGGGGRRFSSREEYEAWKKAHPTQEP